MTASAIVPVDVTIIVVTYNSRRFFERLRRALDALVTPHALIIVDNGSRDGERPTTDDFPTARILQQDANLGFAAGNNVAARAATTPYIALLNPDAFPEPDWLRELLETAARHGPLTAVGSTQILDADRERYDGLGDVMHVSGLAYRAAHGTPRSSVAPPDGEVFSACAAALLLRRAVFLDLGGFDESFFCYMEDVEFGFRLRLAGGCAVQAPRAVVVHVSGGVSAAHSGFADFHGARNRVWTFLQCMPALWVWLLLPLHVAATMAVLVVHAAQGRWASWRGAWAGVAGASAALKRRRAIQAQRAASSLRILRALAWSPFVLIGRRVVVRRPTSQP